MAEPVLSPLGIYELRYLRKAVRWRLWLKGAYRTPGVGTRSTMPSRSFETGHTIEAERAQEIDEMADWFVQEAAQ